ncbi:TetR family transcriptional regulator C-terminal domain-containing protein, partial [Mycobacterium sp. E2462]|uniref:TetR family transcriptional regulator C-terminal domain-containing protein n=1 Tax=Mycobacterium sp. E2462 TaxID=1834133 RepID=UPI000A54237A
DDFDALQAWADACVADIDTVYRVGGCVYGSLAGELIEGDDDIHRDLSAGYDQWIELLRTGLTAMRDRGDLRPEADPRHLAVSLVIAHQGGAMLTYVTGDAEPLRAAVTAGVEYVRSFAPPTRYTVSMSATHASAHAWRASKSSSPPSRGCVWKARKSWWRAPIT